MTSIRVAAVHAEPVWRGIDGTVQKTITLIREPAGKDGDGSPGRGPVAPLA